MSRGELATNLVIVAVLLFATALLLFSVINRQSEVQSVFQTCSSRQGMCSVACNVTQISIGNEGCPDERQCCISIG